MSNKASFFEIRREKGERNVSVVINFEALRGVGIMRHVTTDGEGSLATGQLLGFLSRDVVTGGPTTLQRTGAFQGPLEFPDTAGGQCSLRLAQEVEVEGADYIVQSGTGAITTGTAVGTVLSFADGKFRQKQSSDLGLFILARQITPDMDGNTRIVADAIL